MGVMTVTERLKRSPIEWLHATDAALVLGTDAQHVKRLARDGLISVRRVPGAHPRYSRADVELIAHEFTSPADVLEPAAIAERVAAWRAAQAADKLAEPSETAEPAAVAESATVEAAVADPVVAESATVEPEAVEPVAAVKPAPAAPAAAAGPFLCKGGR
jgi:hypothetical protein